MKAYEWMADFTPQTKWIERKGIFIFFAEVCGVLGGGLYLVSAYLNNIWGMFIGFVIIAGLKAVFHTAHLGKPFRFWRLALKPGSSWLARGFIFLVLFTFFGAIQLALSYWAPATGLEVTFRIIAGVMAVLVTTYTGFMMNYVNGIPLWNSALLPVLSLLFGLLGGSALFIAIGLFGSKANIVSAIEYIRWLLVISAFVVSSYLLSASYMGPAGKESVREMIRGRIAPALWIGVVLCGMFVPAILVYLVGEISVPYLVMNIVCILIGVFSLHYCILKGGLYSPLIPISW